MDKATVQECLNLIEAIRKDIPSWEEANLGRLLSLYARINAESKPICGHSKNEADNEPIAGLA